MGGTTVQLHELYILAKVVKVEIVGIHTAQTLWCASKSQVPGPTAPGPFAHGPTAHGFQPPTPTAPSTWQTLALVVRTMQVLRAPMLVPANWLARGTAAVRGIR